MNGKLLDLGDIKKTWLAPSFAQAAVLVALMLPDEDCLRTN
ncbi:hypothetical protein [Desulfosporosinus sp. OT]|nr:hypothetical protein [Desulfosporosinus sp. OT]EGW36398.1 hypothetical protein DOT_5706 [Desulfosporosinus sp. OT]